VHWRLGGWFFRLGIPTATAQAGAQIEIKEFVVRLAAIVAIPC